MTFIISLEKAGFCDFEGTSRQIVGRKLIAGYAGMRERNMIFTGMTRAKGWLRVSGIGQSAAACKREIDSTLKKFPYLSFSYPSEEQLKVMRRDLAEKAIRKQRTESMLRVQWSAKKLRKLVVYAPR